MGPVKIVRIVSFSSEDPNQPAENLTRNDTYRKWRCKENGEPKAWVELQLEKLCTISSIDIGNHGSAFIEVLAGRTGSSEDNYKVLLHSSTFMTPQECRNGTNLQRVRIFKSAELNKATLSEKWDRIRVVCTQPFNKQLQYGISFITVNAEEDEAKVKSPQEKNSIDFGIFKLKEESKVEPVTQGSLFSRFKSLKSTTSNDSYKSQPGDLRVVSQSLAAAALNESEKEASRILKPSPRKVEERPNINLMQKLKTFMASPESHSIEKFKKKQAEDDSPLRRRKLVEVDNIPAPAVVSTSLSSPKEIKKEKKKVPKTDRKIEESPSAETNGKDSAHFSSKKRKSSGKEEETSINKKRKSLSKSDSDNVQLPAKKKQLMKPFNRLLEGDVVVLSGYQNPLRSQLRDKLQAMGAKYKPDWGSSCTHLVCAFYNTPKFREVKGKGKIVTKEWVEECFKQRKRLPWRRFCLDKNDRGEESEKEIWEGEDTTNPSPKKRDHKALSKSPKASASQKEPEDDYGGSTEVDEPDTDDEIERIKKNQR